MPRRAASLTQADIARAIRAAKQAGAESVEYRIGDSIIVIRVKSSTAAENVLETKREIVL